MRDAGAGWEAAGQGVGGGAGWWGERDAGAGRGAAGPGGAGVNYSAGGG